MGFCAGARIASKHRTGTILNMAVATELCPGGMFRKRLSCFENSGSVCMELLQMFGKLRRIKIRQGLYIIEKWIKTRTKFRGGRAKPGGQAIQSQHQPFSTTRLDWPGDLGIAEFVV